MPPFDPTEPSASASPVARPPIHPGPEPGEPRREMVPGRAVLPPALRRRVAWFDATVDRAFDRHLRGRPTVDRVFYTASELGDFSVLWHMIGCARGLRSDRDFVAALRLSGMLGAESVLVNVGIKSLFNRSRPVWEQTRPHKLRRPRSSSFPSGHASSALAAAGLLAEGSRAWPLWYLLAAVVAASRVHVKIHHPSDVVGGAIIGVAVGRVTRRAWRLPESRPPAAG